MLNALLFALVGLAVLILTLALMPFLAALLTIPIVLFARFVGVGAPVPVLRLGRDFSLGRPRS